MTSTLLITGGAGYIGSHAAYAFLEQGFRTVIVDNLVTGHRALVPPQAQFALADIGDGAAMTAIFNEYKPSAVVHFAGSIVVPESVTNPEKYYTNNTLATWTLLRCAHHAGVRAFLFSSTAAVYGNGTGRPLAETDALMPINPYGRSKLASEFMLADYARANGFLSGILRYFNVAGADAACRTGQATPEATHLIKVACEVASGKRTSISLFGTDYATPDGTCVRDYIHVSDLARAHVDVLQHMLTRSEPALFNCGYGQGYSVREVIAAVRALSGHAVPSVDAPRRAGDPPALVANADALKTHVGWTPKHADLQTIVRDALRWEAQQHIKLGKKDHAA